MLQFNGSPSHSKSFPGLVTASATGLTIGAQSIRFGDAVYDIAETRIPIAWSGEWSRFVVWLTETGLVLADAPGDTFPAVEGAVCYLADLQLRAPEDTPETVDVEVVRRECTTETPADARRVAVPAGVVTPAVTPERAAARAREARIRAIDALLAGKRAGAMVAADRNLVIERLALLSGMEP